MNFKDKLFIFIQTAMIVFFIYVGIAELAFAFNNPTANRMQSFVYFGSMLRFESLEQFQGN